MKGKYAAKSTRRRELQVATSVTELQAALAQERLDHHDDVETLKAEVRRLRTEHRREAALIAEREITRRETERKNALRDKGLTEEIVFHHFDIMDKFVRNACRYVSMTKGIHPVNALYGVMTWLTDKDCFGVADP